MRRTPREDIEFVLKCIGTDRKHRRLSNIRWLHESSMSLEFHNILTAMNVNKGGVYGLGDFAASDETYLKAIEILKLVIEGENEMV